MTSAQDTPGPDYNVVVSDEGRYSIWLSYKALPWGWSNAGFTGSRQACLDHINTVWTDMRPLSLRRAIEGGQTDQGRKE